MVIHMEAIKKTIVFDKIIHNTYHGEINVHVELFLFHNGDLCAQGNGSCWGVGINNDKMTLITDNVMDINLTGRGFEGYQFDGRMFSVCLDNTGQSGYLGYRKLYSPDGNPHLVSECTIL